MTPTLSLLAASEVVIMTACGATIDKVGTNTTIGFQGCELWTLNGSHYLVSALMMNGLRRFKCILTGVNLCMDSANKRRHYSVKSSLIDWAHTQTYPCPPAFSRSDLKHRASKFVLKKIPLKRSECPLNSLMDTSSKSTQSTYQMNNLIFDLPTRLIFFAR